MLNAWRFLLIGLLSANQLLAHHTPKSEHELEIQRGLQAAAYHVRIHEKVMEFFHSL